jgi:hypothetical protein
VQILKVKSYFTAQVFIYGAYEIQIWNKNLIVFELRQFCILETITISINFKSNFFKLTLIVFNLETSLFQLFLSESNWFRSSAEKVGSLFMSSDHNHDLFPLCWRMESFSLLLASGKMSNCSRKCFPIFSHNDHAVL